MYQIRTLKSPTQLEKINQVHFYRRVPVFVKYLNFNMEIERGCCTRPITNLEERLCPVSCIVWLTTKLISSPYFVLMKVCKFCYMMSNGDPRTLFGKYVYQLYFNLRNENVMEINDLRIFSFCKRVSIVTNMRLVLIICY